MKITLIQPRKPNFGTENEEHWQLTRPHSLFLLSSALQKYTDYHVKIIDMEKREYDGLTLEKLVSPVSDFEVYGITSTSFNRFNAIECAKKIKELKPESVVVVGGVHFSYLAEETLKAVSEIDIVVIGEGELAFAKLIKALDKGDSLKNIDGICFRSGEQIIQTKDQKDLVDQDVLPLFTDFTWNEYPEYLFGVSEPVPAISILSSRGCPYRCVFCSKAMSGYRVRDPRKVCDEIEFFKDQFQVKAFNFLDLSFTASSKHVKKICEEIRNRKLDIAWWCEIRGNTPLQLLDEIYSAGCKSVVVGIESGSKRILSRISKDITISKVKQVCKKATAINLKVQPYFMFSHPEETIDDVEKTFSLIKELEQYSEHCSFQPSMIFPGTQLEKIAIEKKLFPDGFSWFLPYYSKLNIKLGQLANIPLFIDKFNPKTLINLTARHDQRNYITTLAKEIKKLTIKDITFKAIRAIKRKDFRALKIMFKKEFFKEILKEKDSL